MSKDRISRRDTIDKLYYLYCEGELEIGDIKLRKVALEAEQGFQDYLSKEYETDLREELTDRVCNLSYAQELAAFAAGLNLGLALADK